MKLQKSLLADALGEGKISHDKLPEKFKLDFPISAAELTPDMSLAKGSEATASSMQSTSLIKQNAKAGLLLFGVVKGDSDATEKDVHNFSTVAKSTHTAKK